MDREKIGKIMNILLRSEAKGPKREFTDNFYEERDIFIPSDRLLVPYLFHREVTTKGKETIAISAQECFPNDNIKKQLDEIGCRLIKPLTLSESEIRKMPEEKRLMYLKSRTSKIAQDTIFRFPQLCVIDKDEDHLSLELARTIAKTHFSGIPDWQEYLLPKYKRSNNSLTYNLNSDSLAQSFYSLLQEIGYKVRTNNKGRVTVFSDIPFEVVKENELKKMHEEYREIEKEERKERIDGVFDKIRTTLERIKNKGKDKENGKNINENDDFDTHER